MATVSAIVFEPPDFWHRYKELFLAQLLRDRSPAGGPTAGGRTRASSFCEWDGDAEAAGAGSKRKRNEDQTAARARLIFFIIAQALVEFSNGDQNDDQGLLDSADEMGAIIAAAYSKKALGELWGMQHTSLKMGDVMQELTIAEEE